MEQYESWFMAREEYSVWLLLSSSFIASSEKPMKDASSGWRALHPQPVLWAKFERRSSINVGSIHISSLLNKVFGNSLTLMNCGVM